METVLWDRMGNNCLCLSFCYLLFRFIYSNSCNMNFFPEPNSIYASVHWKFSSIMSRACQGKIHFRKLAVLFHCQFSEGYQMYSLASLHQWLAETEVWHSLMLEDLLKVSYTSKSWHYFHHQFSEGYHTLSFPPFISVQAGVIIFTCLIFSNNLRDSSCSIWSFNSKGTCNTFDLS